MTYDNYKSRFHIWLRCTYILINTVFFTLCYDLREIIVSQACDIVIYSIDILVTRCVIYYLTWSSEVSIHLTYEQQIYLFLKFLNQLKVVVISNHTFNFKAVIIRLIVIYKKSIPQDILFCVLMKVQFHTLKKNNYKYILQILERNKLELFGLPYLRSNSP
jgi:hypothetical protein